MKRAVQRLTQVESSSTAADLDLAARGVIENDWHGLSITGLSTSRPHSTGHPLQPGMDITIEPHLSTRQIWVPAMVLVLEHNAKGSLPTSMYSFPSY